MERLSLLLMYACGISTGLGLALFIDGRRGR